MNHQDHVALLRAGVSGSGLTWADFGSGSGAFTLALADLLGPGGKIYSIDRDRRALEQQRRTIDRRYPEVKVTYRVADFTQPLELPPLDGLVMANALHFVRNKEPVVRLLRDYLHPDGRFILVEYNTDRGNRWVPYPLAYPTWERLATACGLPRTWLSTTRPSSFLGEFYAAVSER